MINVAIVEDEAQAAQQLTDFLKKLQEKTDERFEISVYENADSFFFDFHSQFELVFMDIQLPHMNGMKAAEKLRKIDQLVALVFVTNLSRYAINGYEVGALDYILKPLEYDAFQLKMLKVLRYCRLIQRENQAQIILSTENGEIRTYVSDLVYVEISGHRIVYHTTSQDYTSYGTMKEVEKKLAPYGLFRCNSCYLVNLFFVRKVEGFTVTVDQTELTISHPRKKEFMNALARYTQKGGDLV